MTKVIADQQDKLDVTREKGARALALGACAMVPLSPLCAWLAGNSIGLLSTAALAFAALSIFGMRMKRLSGRVLVAFGLVGQAICITSALAGHPWQLDAHMLFFALLAACMLMVEPAVIVMTAGIIAVHHLGLSLALPALVYPSSDILANLQRTALHGVIVVVEAVLLWSALRQRVRAHHESLSAHKTILASEAEAHAAVALAEEEKVKSAQALVKAEEAQKQAKDAQVAAEEETAKAFAADKTARALEAQEREKFAAIEAEQRLVVDHLGAALAKLSQGNLSVQITADFPTAYEQLRKTYNAALHDLESAMSLVGQNARTITTDVASLEQAATSLANRTEAQAKTLEDTSATISQIAENSKDAADSARNATHAVESAQTKTGASAEIVGNAIAAMSSIETSSGQISKIVELIENIAFQTNLLALNAGVEAARAGEAGRGFSVVASEVRELARRSSEAAQDIAGLIDESGRHVASGVKLVQETGTALEDIRTEVEMISQQIAAIAQSSEEQAVGISETNDAIRQLESVTQQNAAMFEETNAVTQSLAQQADQLAKSMDGFTLSSMSTQSANVSKTPPSVERDETLKRVDTVPAAHGNLAIDADTTDTDGWEDF